MEFRTRLFRLLFGFLAALLAALVHLLILRPLLRVEDHLHLLALLIPNGFTLFTAAIFLGQILRLLSSVVEQFFNLRLLFSGQVKLGAQLLDVGTTFSLFGVFGGVL